MYHKRITGSGWTGRRRRDDERLGGMAAKYRRRLNPSVAQAWCAFDRAAELSSRVTPAAPVLFFGDLDAYCASPLRVLTVGLNPSLNEFPAGDPFRRFPLLAGTNGDSEPDHYLDAISAYFRTDPYRGWFSAFEPLLNGAGASYYASEASTALHTDICSPVATNPTWSQLGETDRVRLEADGGPVWHMLLEALRPHVVVLSVSRDHLRRIQFAPVAEWQAIHVFTRTGRGGPRSRPYEVRARPYEIVGRSLFVFGPAAQKPFGLLSDNQKYEVGAIALERYQSGR